MIFSRWSPDTRCRRSRSTFLLGTRRQPWPWYPPSCLWTPCPLPAREACGEQISTLKGTLCSVEPAIGCVTREDHFLLPTRLRDGWRILSRVALKGKTGAFSSHLTGTLCVARGGWARRPPGLGPPQCLAVSAVPLSEGVSVRAQSALGGPSRGRE